MNPSAILRSQLTEKKRPAAEPSDGQAADAGECHPCFRTCTHARGVKFETGEVVASFPYSHYLYAHLTEEKCLAIRFATHRVDVFGKNLERLLDELTVQRLELLRILPGRMKDLANTKDVWIERMQISEARVEPNRLPH
jgi:hypothetical protein